MIAQIIAAAFVAASPTPAAMPTQQLTTPMREVVFKVETTDRADFISESYGGGENAVPPSSTGLAGGTGTVTVDMMAKFEDGVLAVKIGELWKSNKLPLRYAGAVAPDGTVEFASATIAPVTVELLPFFATRFAPEGTLAVGTHWSVEKAVGKGSVLTTYAVIAVSSDSVTIHKDVTIKSLGSETVDGTVVYEPSMLAPISGKLRVRRTDMSLSGQTMRTIDLTFERISDTFQAAAPQHP